MTLPDSDDMDGVDANQLGALASQVQNWHTHPQILAVNIASPRYSWTLLVPRTLYTILSTSAFLSIMTVVLAVADVNSQVVLAATFGPLTYLTIIHHLFMLMVPRLSPSSRAPDIPRFTSNTHLWLLGLLVFGWTVAVCVAVPLGIILADGTKGVFVVDILFMSCEVFALLFLFIICARSRKRLLSNPDGEVNGTGSHGLRYVCIVLRFIPVIANFHRVFISGVIGSPTMHYDPPPDYQHETPDEEFFGRTNKTPENNHSETRKKMRNVDSDPSDMLPEYMEDATRHA
ncbi:hypothetical protein BD410DRAFT_842354 [Rickenella mellea]|uniref:Uncharacterized protein n=1 Tax=Rickenella mellea TaxID=50990 RepID=A0A4Y7PUM4_9AGAM|nr:hypothetical protein BD410DRAFT_842354 [Rickenella mellea]